METTVEMMAPVVTLVAWSMIMWVWMYATRIPAILRAGIKPDPTAPSGQQMSLLPSAVRWKADNYNHLMEQPTVFYALTIALTLMAEGTGVNLYFAWAYVGLRIAHSLVQVLGNKIEVRFVLHVLSNIPLFGLTVSAMMFFMH